MLLHFFNEGEATTEIYALRRASSSTTSNKLTMHHVATFEYPRFLASYVNGNRDQTELLGRICGGSMSHHVEPRVHCVRSTATILYMLRYVGRPSEDNPRLVHVMDVSVFLTAADAFVVCPHRESDNQDIGKPLDYTVTACPRLTLSSWRYGGGSSGRVQFP